LLPTGLQLDPGHEVRQLHDVGGKKSTAQGIFYSAMTNLEQKGRRGLKLFKKAIETASRCWK